MATNHRKKRRKEYLHRSNDDEQFGVPKTTFYRRERKCDLPTAHTQAQSSSWATTLPGPSNAPSIDENSMSAAASSNECTDPAIGIGSDSFDEIEAPLSSGTAADSAANDDPLMDSISEEELLGAAFAAFSSEKLPNLGTSKAGAVAMAMSFAVAHGLTWMALGDLCVLINSIAGTDVLPRNKYGFRKLWSARKADLVETWYLCHVCKAVVTTVGDETVL